jgi:hypothetical protein
MAQGNTKAGEKRPTYVLPIAEDGDITGRIDPAAYHQTITPDDETDLSPVPSALYVSAGDLEVVDAAGVSVTYTIDVGGLFPFMPTRIGEATTSTVIGWYHADPS